MKVPLSWMKEYVPVELPAEEIARRLTMAGVEVTGIERTHTWNGIIVGHVRSVRPHPNADRLRLVTVDRGSAGEIEVVCGAPNVAEGQRIAFAGVGADVIDGHTGKASKLKAGKIRGVESPGMVLSEKELGMSGDHEGIVVLDPAAPVGRPLSEVLGETVLDLELSPNRPDCLGVLGVAREVGALVGLGATEPALGYRESGPDAHSLARVTIEAADLCPRYTATVIRGVKVGPSPNWLQDRLRALGERPVNNVVDATNYVMFELGQPLHAFDFDLVAGRHVIVRRARSGEKLATLDGVERTLTDEMLVIADPERAIGLAGVMGGANSEITERTVNVLLESANFHAVNNRKTARGLGLASEATVRFEKGLRAGLAEVGLRRCVGMILEVAGGDAARGVIDEWPGRGNEVNEIFLTQQRVQAVLGVEWPAAQVVNTLRSLGFEPVPALAAAGGQGAAMGDRSASWSVRVPYWRPDITIPEDLCEELARVIGYDQIPQTVVSGRVPRWEPQAGLNLREKVRDALVAAGIQEMISYTATSERNEERVRLSEKTPGHVKLANPLSADWAVMRRTLRENALRTFSDNARTWRGPVAMFEIGKVFLDHGEGLPEEREMVVGVLGGLRSETHWAGEQTRLDFFDAKGAVEAVLEALRVEGAFSPGADSTLAAGRVAAVTSPRAGGLRVGIVGEVDPQVMTAFGIDAGPVAMFELDLEALGKAVDASRSSASPYKPFGRFPASPRDLALLLDDGVPAGEVLRMIERNRLVASASVFDVYRGKGVATGRKSLAVRVVYQAADRTLTSEEVDAAEKSILNALSSQLGAELRK
ncbi:MAG: phenylalanine--tRNA ligase subunit beta [Dehalococcoidia bacterium]|nr:phenylalanine--tRNA ligase subunit beta [Dehalococcoidia bacterium]MSQ34736.1 phenylalanine--tRNA ligase subunit beta [Dehalococcoidia bacterium]